MSRKQDVVKDTVNGSKVIRVSGEFERLMKEFYDACGLPVTKITEVLARELKRAKIRVVRRGRGYTLVINLL